MASQYRVNSPQREIEIVAQRNCASGGDGVNRAIGDPVSYTHLDVYKRQ